MKRYLVVYLTLGYPTKDEFLKLVSTLNDLSIDFVEVGIPPRFAKYDGPVIRKSYEYAKKMLPERQYLALIREARGILDVPMIALAYVDDRLDKLREFVEDLYQVGVDSILFPDLLIDYLDVYEKVEEIARSIGIGLTLFTSPSMPDRLIERVSPSSRFFLYLGVRPATGVPIPVDPVRLVRRVRGIVRNRLVVGFGLSLSDIPEIIRAGADGIAIGSALIEAIERNGIGGFTELVRTIRGVINGV